MYVEYASFGREVLRRYASKSGESAAGGPHGSAGDARCGESAVGGIHFSEGGATSALSDATAAPAGTKKASIGRARTR